MKIIFISDLHLSANTIANNVIFCNLLSKWVKEIDQLYILGDLFDTWIGDDDQNEFISQIQKALKEFSQYKPVFFIRGNHDYLIGKKFSQLTGVKILPDLTIIQQDDLKIMLSHGDAFCTLNKSYQWFKLFYNNRLIKFISANLPLKLRKKILYYVQVTATKNKSHKDKPYAGDKYKVNHKTIINLANKLGASTIIHGHTHDPNIEYLNDGINTFTRAEIPDWQHNKAGGYLLLEDSQLSLRTLV